MGVFFFLVGIRNRYIATIEEKPFNLRHLLSSIRATQDARLLHKGMGDFGVDTAHVLTRFCFYVET